ncbi:GntR family transcriptional regulator [Labrys sp. KNU-23]|uniref:GntR family transcriptional regulator n=1 Tax=Labrys sp. KNU-23 TaxID=2789216 RepID=UPI0011ECBAF8|nr:GntR family transcriptional regulator [Labrys sp. KNU-23]QEN90477.1 GntR family transcriptional regulator [Labrys sp. KNU-23]
MSSSFSSDQSADRSEPAESAEVERLIDYLQRKGRLETESPTALYRRLQDALRSAISEGIVPAGAMIPGERELAQRLDLSRVTVRNAIKGLVEERLLVQRHGARTSVALRLEKPMTVFTSFSEDMEARGRVPSTTWLRREVGRADTAEAMALGLSPGAAVCRLHRLRLADRVPMAIEYSVLPAEFLPSPDLIEGSLYVTLDRRGCQPVRALQRVRADVATAHEARLLEIETGAPILEMERRCSLENGRVVELTRSRYRGDAYDFMVELARRGS